MCELLNFFQHLTYYAIKIKSNFLKKENEVNLQDSSLLHKTLPEKQSYKRTDRENRFRNNKRSYRNCGDINIYSKESDIVACSCSHSCTFLQSKSISMSFHDGVFTFWVLSLLSSILSPGKQALETSRENDLHFLRTVRMVRPFFVTRTNEARIIKT